MASYPSQNNLELLRYFIGRKVDPHIALILQEWADPIAQVESSIQLLEDFTKRMTNLKMNVEESMAIYITIKDKNFGLASKMIKEYEQKADSVEKSIDMSEKQEQEVMQLPRPEQPREMEQLGINRIADHIAQTTNYRTLQNPRQLQNYEKAVPEPIAPDILSGLQNFKNKETKITGYAYQNQFMSDTAIDVSKPPISQASEESIEGRAQMPYQSSENGAKIAESIFPVVEKVQREHVIELDKLSPTKIYEFFRNAKTDIPESQNSLPNQFPEKEGHSNQHHIYSHQEPVPIPLEKRPMDSHAKESQQVESELYIAERDSSLYHPYRQQIANQGGTHQVQYRDQMACQAGSLHSQVSKSLQQYPPNESGQVLIQPNPSVSYCEFPSDENPCSDQQISYNQLGMPNYHPPISSTLLHSNQPPNSQCASQPNGPIQLYNRSQTYAHSSPNQQFRMHQEGQYHLQSYDRSQPYAHSHPNEQFRMHQEGQFPVQIPTLPSISYPPLPQHMKSSPAAACCICNSSHNQPALRQLTICNHIVHEDCFVNFTTSQISRDALPDKCPHSGCISNLHPQDVELTLPESYNLRFQRLYTKQVLLNSGLEIFECPNCQNVSENLGSEQLQCPYCKIYYCLRCNSETHPGQMCRNLSRDTLCVPCQVNHAGMTCYEYTRYLAEQFGR